VLEALGEIKPRRRDEKHLDVRKFIGDAARDAACQHDLFDHGWQRIGDLLCDLPEFA
jgi:hypothetical protein